MRPNTLSLDRAVNGRKQSRMVGACERLLAHVIPPDANSFGHEIRGSVPRKEASSGLEVSAVEIAANMWEPFACLFVLLRSAKQHQHPYHACQSAQTWGDEHGRYAGLRTFATFGQDVALKPNRREHSRIHKQCGK
jgi:hypothetical protein